MSRQKGNKAEREAVELYESAGYQADRVSSGGGGRRMTDLFGEFDVIAVPAAGALGPVRLAQVKGGGTAAGRETYPKRALPYASAPVTVELLVRHDGHGGPHPTPPRWRLLQPAADPEYRCPVVVDERADGVDPDGEGVVAYLEGE